MASNKPFQLPKPTRVLTREPGTTTDLREDKRHDDEKKADERAARKQRIKKAKG